jgi:hypothetical protein
MSFKKTELYRGFNIFTEKTQAGVWGVSVVEIPSSESTTPGRSPDQGRVPGGHPSKEVAVLAARMQIDRIHKNRQNKTSQAER